VSAPPEPDPPRAGFRVGARAQSFRFALRGLVRVLASQHNAWIHALVSASVVALGILLGVGRLEWALLSLAIGLVWAAEALNTAIESLSDRISREHDPWIESAKDAAAGGVLAAALAAAAAGAFVFGPRLLARVATLFGID
jgi:diacylglycerol kinase (ATP)